MLSQELSMVLHNLPAPAGTDHLPTKLHLNSPAFKAAQIIPAKEGAAQILITTSHGPEREHAPSVAAPKT